MAEPQISIVIPSHNRRELLREVLDALAAQAPGTPAFEVIVVADGCHDGTEGAVASYVAPFPVRVLQMPGVGPSRARNAGAAAARADLLLFLDDDVIPTERLVAAHWQAHAEQAGRAVIGPYPPEPTPGGDRFRLNARRWWNAHFEDLARPGHRYAYTDLLTGNLSLARATWNELGGLDPQFARAREDLELGVRLLKAGVALHFAPDALGWHQEHLTTSPDSALKRAREEGRSDALMALKHPDIAPVLRAARVLRRAGATQSRKLRFVRKTGFLAERIIRAGPALLARIERLGLTGLRRRAENALREYCYLRGAVEALGNGLEAFCAQPLHTPAKAEVDIDLDEGIEAAERYLSLARPASARLTAAGQTIGTMPWNPAAERWDGRHLRPFLARRAARAAIPLFAERAFGGTVTGWSGLPALHNVGNRDFMNQLFEAQRQWRRPAPPAPPSSGPRPYVPDRRLVTRGRQMVHRIMGNGLFRPTQSPSSAEAQEAARGWLLLFVFFIHAMIGTAAYLGPQAHATYYVLKILAPDVSAFFFLSGMAAPNVAAKVFAPVLRMSLVLLIFAAISHIGGFLIQLAGGQYATAAVAARALLLPLVTGTDTASFVAWFFVVLAIARLYAYAWLRSKIAFVVLVLVTWGAIRLGHRLGLPDNLFEWRNWPTATLFFLIGMRLPDPRKLPNWAGLGAMAGTVLLALINRHGLFRLGPCFTCDPWFVAQPMVGQYGSILVYVPQQILFVLALLWIAQRSGRTIGGHTARFFGRASLPMLLLHGWVLLTLYPGMLAALPRSETPFLYIAVFCTALVVHAVLYTFVAKPLDWLQRGVFKLVSGRIAFRRR